MRYPKGYFPVTRNCKLCGTPFICHRPATQCCSKKCSVRFQNIRRLRAQEAYELLYTWANDRKNRRGVLTAIYNLARGWGQEDAASGRRYVRQKVHDGCD